MLMQALMHLLLDLGELGATLFILWRCLHAYQPLALGWFRARLRPLRSWLCPALLACAFFPLVDLAAARSQVRPLCQVCCYFLLLGEDIVQAVLPCHANQMRHVGRSYVLIHTLVHAGLVSL